MEIYELINLWKIEEDIYIIIGNKTKGRCVSGGKKCSFFGKFGMLCFLETPVLRFALLPYYRRYISRDEFIALTA